MFSLSRLSSTVTILITEFEFLITVLHLVDSSSLGVLVLENPWCTLLFVLSAGDDHQTSGGAVGSEEEAGGQEIH